MPISNANPLPRPPPSQAAAAAGTSGPSAAALARTLVDFITDQQITTSADASRPQQFQDPNDQLTKKRDDTFDPQADPADLSLTQAPAQTLLPVSDAADGGPPRQPLI